MWTNMPTHINSAPTQLLYDSCYDFQRKGNKQTALPPPICLGTQNNCF
uniref:Uncharacterized protein n=1 Tax=Anguilla anguilla TaxID=7936 RepID=A0A0E9UP06_ANGAN